MTSRPAGLLVLVACLWTAPAWAGSPIGLWLTQNGQGVVEITQCGTDLCGRIAGIGRFQADGSMPKDAHGVPDCHLELMPDMKPTGENLWRGNIYNPESGETYDAEFHVDAQDRLQLRGFIVLPLFGSTQVWTRYTGRLTADCHMKG